MAPGQLYFRRVLPDGTRLISWRTWVLIWVTPALFVAAALLMFGVEGWRHAASVPAKGKVVRVYAWRGGTIFDRGQTNYGPVFRYTWTDGQPTEATSGLSHPDFDFDIGSVHDIRYFPNAKRNIVLPGIHNWTAPSIILGIGALTFVPALWGTARLRRWQKGGRR